MSGYKSRTSDSDSKRFNSVYRRFVGYCISAVDGKRKFRVPRNIHSDDWYTWTDQLNISVTWINYKIFITAASLAGFGAGIWQIATKLVGRE